VSSFENPARNSVETPFGDLVIKQDDNGDRRALQEKLSPNQRDKNSHRSNPRSAGDWSHSQNQFSQHDGYYELDIDQEDDMKKPNASTSLLPLKDEIKP
jgi:hypothetical protein